MSSKKRLYKPDTIYLSATVAEALQPLLRSLDIEELTVRSWVGTLPLYCHKQSLAAIEHLGEWLEENPGEKDREWPDMEAFRAYLAQRFTQQTTNQYARRAQAFLTSIKGTCAHPDSEATDVAPQISTTTPALASLCETLGVHRLDAELWALHRQRKFRNSSAMTMLNRFALWLQETGGVREPTSGNIAQWREHLRGRYCNYYVRKHLVVLTGWLRWIERRIATGARRAPSCTQRPD